MVRSVEQVVETIGRGAERTARIVQDLRTFSRASEAERVATNLEEGIEVSIRLLQTRWEGRIEIERDYAALPAVEVVPGQMNQVFMNLLANACDAIEGPGHIRVTTRRVGEEVRIAIADDGSGIAEADLGRLFDPFFTTKPQGHGTGLGLSISHGIVADHGGRIEVESTQGRGTTFTIVLPIRARAVEPMGDPMSPR